MNTDKEDENTQWESELMLKDQRWSMVKGLKNVSDGNTLKATPIIIRHDNANKKDLTNIPVPPLNLSDSQKESNGEDVEQDYLMEGLEEGRIGANVYENENASEQN